MVDLPGEARILARLLDVDLRPDLPDLLASFAPDTRVYAEFQVTLDPPGLALVTMGAGAAHVDRVAEHLRRLGVAGAGMDLLAQVTAAAPGSAWGLKLDLTGHAGAAPAGVQTYVKRPLPVGQVVDRLARAGVAADARGILTRMAAELGRSHTHFLGLTLAPGADPAFALYFTQFVAGTGNETGRGDHADTPPTDVGTMQPPADMAGDGVVERVSRVLDLVGVPGHRSVLAAAHPVLARDGQTLWVSVGVEHGRVQPSVKLDYGGADLDDVARVAALGGASEAARARLDELRATLGVRSVGYLGWRLQDPQVFSLYLTRTRGTVRP